MRASHVGSALPGSPPPVTHTGRSAEGARHLTHSIDVISMAPPTRGSEHEGHFYYCHIAVDTHKRSGFNVNKATESLSEWYTDTSEYHTQDPE